MENIKNIKECEGVPNGSTPANVGGMGAIQFPCDGHVGSGDLPKPSGVGFYKQIMPFDSFIRQNWKKKKKIKKKPNSPDSPYYKHSPNPSEYKYVYDFKTYMDKAKEEL